jgi:predicted lactoylglutathione lyase
MRDRTPLVTLPVRDLPRSVAFFSALGFPFAAECVGGHRAFIVINGEASVMLAAEPVRRTLTPRGRTPRRCLVAKSRTTASCSTAVYDLDGHGGAEMWMNLNPAPSSPSPRDMA